ncbi:MAG: hypothetical protein HY290_25150 [Planctomycetia bacterium]|nr:hypothetical protein [Planctomycetia bacterium]
MNQKTRNVWLIIVLWAILCGPAWAAADDDDEPPPADVPADGGAVIDESIVDQLIFRENRAKGGFQQLGNPGGGRARVESQLKALLDELVQTCELNEDQQKRLALAARGDIKRFFERIEEVRKKVRAARNDQNQAQTVWQEVSPLQQQFSRGLFGDESLFAKTVRKTLSEDQQAKYRAALLDRRRIGYRAAIDASLARLGNGVVLKREQQAALKKLLLDETQPPLIFGQYDQQLVLLRLSQLPAAKLREVLDKGQWKQLRPHLLQASGTEDYLAQFGVVEGPKPNSPVILRSVRTVIETPAFE